MFLQHQRQFLSRSVIAALCSSVSCICSRNLYTNAYCFTKLSPCRQNSWFGSIVEDRNKITRDISTGPRGGLYLKCASTDVKTEESSSSSIVEVFPFQLHSHNSAQIIIPQNNNESRGCESNDPFERSMFRQKLRATIALCKSMKKSALWIEVPL